MRGEWRATGVKLSPDAVDTWFWASGWWVGGWVGWLVAAPGCLVENRAWGCSCRMFSAGRIQQSNQELSTPWSNQGVQPRRKERHRPEEPSSRARDVRSRLYRVLPLVTPYLAPLQYSGVHPMHAKDGPNIQRLHQLYRIHTSRLRPPHHLYIYFWRCLIVRLSRLSSRIL